MQPSKLFWLTGCICLFMLNGFSAQRAFAFQNAVWVSPTGNDSADGSQATPYQTINHALSTISANDTVLLMPGTFQENVAVAALGDFVMKSASAIDSAHIQATQTGPALYISGVGVATSRNTIIENILFSHAGGIDGPAIQLEMATATLRNNRIFNNQSTSGAAVLISSDGSHQPLLENNIIEFNTAQFGAGVFVSTTQLEMRYNIFRNNSASQRGGAVHFTNCNGTITSGNTFFANQADSGAAIFIESSAAASTPTNSILDNFIIKNRANMDGGGVFYQGNSVIWRFTGNTFAENLAANGAAGYFYTTNNIIIQRNIVVQNFAGNNGGAFVFDNIGSASVNLWSNNITGNTATANGGGIYVNNTSLLTIGGASNLTNNLFHNRDRTGLNNITAFSSISNLNLSQNYWGHRDSSSVLQQLSIPNLDQNLTWGNFSLSPINVKLKLFEPRGEFWFNDGQVQITGGLLQPVADSVLIIRTNPDTSFTVNDNASSLPKVYSFDWSSTTLSSASARLTFFLDETELNAMGNPFYQNLRVLQNDNSNWTATNTDADVDGMTISTLISDLTISDYTIGLDINASDTVLIVDPLPNRADVNRDTPINIRFQKTMEAASLTKKNIRIHGSASGNRDFAIDFDTANNRLFLKVNDQLQAGEQVSVVLSDSLKTTSGETFNGYSWQYITSAFRGNANFQSLGNIQVALGTNTYLFNDFNDDGIAELVELSGNTLTVYTVGSDGNLNNGQSQDLSTNYTFLKLADLDNDFVNDIILFNDSEALAYSYNPANGFNSIFSNNFGAGTFLNDVIIYDFNNDGIPDMAFLRDLTDFRQIDCFYGSFETQYGLSTSTSVLLSSGPLSEMSLLDWNADGLFDLVVSNGSSSSNLALISNQKTSFSSTINPLPEIFSQQALTTANVWDDQQFQNQSEIVLAGQTEGSDLLKLFNIDADGALVETHVHPFALPVQDICAADLNSDGYNDLAVAYDTNIKILLSDPSGFLKDTLQINAGMSVTDIQIIDFDGDSDLDLFIYEQQDGQTLWQILVNETRSPRSWWVDASSNGGDGSLGKPFTTINDAVAKTFENDSIFIFPGKYEENLLIKHGLFISSVDSLPFVLNPAADNFFQNATLSAADASYLSLNNFNITRPDIEQNARALNIANTDSLLLKGILIDNYDTAVQLSASKGIIEKVRTENNRTGLIVNNSEFAIFNSAFEQNALNGIVSNSSVLDIYESSIRENGTQNDATNSGITVANGSLVSLSKSESSRNGNANILVNNATLNTQFVYVGRASSFGQSSAGNGINAANNATINIFNAVLDNNFTTGITLDNSDAFVQNSILVNNDSLRSQNGGGLFAKAGSRVDLRNSILFGNNTAFSNNSSTITAEYNNFFGNATEPSAANLGIGNLNENPLLVFMYNPLGLISELDGFPNAKLAPGSPLIDRGDPNITNGSGLSRSDIGIFGNIGLPETFETIPDLALQNEDSSVTLSWSAVSAQESDLWVATAVYRNGNQNFRPDTTDLLTLLPKGITTFTDISLNLTSANYYRIAYVDSNGGTNAYSNEAAYRDLSAPQVSFDITYPDTLRQSGLSFIYSASDSINSSIGTPTDMLTYTYRFSSIVNDQPLLLSTDTTQRRRVDFYPLANGKYRFEVAAIDKEGNGGLGSNSISDNIVIKINDLNVAPKLWQMITVPRRLLDSGVSINRESIESLRHWNGTEYEYATIDSVKPGKGYWVITKNRKKIDLTRFPMIESASDFSMDIAKGWNMIGNPWSWNISLDSLAFKDSGGVIHPLAQAVTRKLLNPAFYLWRTKKDTQEYQQPTLNMLRVNMGYWMYANEAGQLQFNPRPFVPEDLSILDFLKKDIANNDAVVRLKARQGSRQDNANYFGVCSDKSLYPLFYQDALEAPSFNNNISLYNKKDAIKRTSNLLHFADMDSVYSWDLFIEGNDRGQDIELTWELSNPQTSLFFFLYNLENGEWINLAEQESFVINSGIKSIPLKLFVSTDENFTPAVLPTKFSLSQNYPNPFNPTTSIKVSIPYFADGKKVTLDVFDVLGRKVKNILNRTVKSGEIVVTWQGTNELGDKVASGIYFYRLQAADFISSKKMILIH